MFQYVLEKHNETQFSWQNESIWTFLVCLLFFLSLADLLLHLKLTADAVEPFESMVAGKENLVAVDQAGHDEIEECLKP